MRTTAFALALFGAMLLFAGLRPAIEQFIRALLGLPAHLLAQGARGLRNARRFLTHVVDRGRTSLCYGGSGTEPSAWDLVAPLVYLLLFAVIALGDLVLAGLRFGALLGLEVTGLVVEGATLDLLAGSLFLAVLATFGCALLDTAGITPLHRPYGLATGSARTVLLCVTGGGAALSAVAAAIFFTWGQYAVLGQPSDDAATLFVALFALLLVGASILAAGGAVGAVPALWTLLCALTAVLLAAVAYVLDLVVTVLDGAHRLLVAAVRVLAAPGTLIWNWLAGLRIGSTLGIARVPDADEIEPLVLRQDELDLVGG